MVHSIAVTESYLNSVFGLEPLEKKMTFNTIKQLAENPRSKSLQIHGIDRIKCDTKFRSARVNDDIRVIFVDTGETYSLLYVDHHDDAYKWCEGKYLKKTNFGAEYVYDENTMIVSQQYQEKKSNPFMTFTETPLLKKQDIKQKDLVKLGVPMIHAEYLLLVTNEDSFIDYVGLFPSEIQEALLDLVAGNKSLDEVYNDLFDQKFNEETDDALQQKDSKRRFYIVESMEELELLMDNDSTEKWNIFLHPSQEVIAKKDFSGPALIEGGPGTGKTVVGIHRAIYLAQHLYPASENKRILICTFSKKLARYISDKLQDLMNIKGSQNNIDIFGVDSFIFSTLSKIDNTPVNERLFYEILSKIYSLNPIGSKKFYEYEYHEIIEKYNITSLDEYLKVDRSGTGMPLDAKKRMVVWNFFEKLLKEKAQKGIVTYNDKAQLLYESLNKGTILPMYDSIIIDEAQDLEPIKLKALCKCVKSQRNNIMILSDMNQRIFRLSTWKNDVDLNVVGRTHHLSINYRTTKQISNYARHQFIESEMIRGHIKEYKSIVNGDEPIVEGFKNESGQFKFIAARVSELIKSGRRESQICIVCPTISDCDQIKSVLTVADINTTVLNGDIIPMPDSGVCICTIQGVKGLEFEVVFLFNYNKIGKFMLHENASAALKVNYIKLIECEKYVAATRARDELIITYVEEGV